MSAVSARRSGPFLFAFAMPVSALAGMTMPGFTDIAQARFQVLSFFLILYLALALIYHRIWNGLAKDFPRLPPIRYRGALGVLAVCGLFIYVVLTMISGARELMTPGAWARSGVFYSIRDPEKESKPWLDAARRGSLERLRPALWQYAAQHGGAFPSSREDRDFPARNWESIDPSGLPLAYMPGLKPDSGQNVLAYEPADFGANRFVLLSSGEIVELSAQELTLRLKKQIDSMDAAIPKANP